MLQTLLFSCQFIKLHAQDFLDQRVIEHGRFTPHIEEGKIQDAISEVVAIMNFSVQHKDLKINFDQSGLRQGARYTFDKRRLQQVVLNLLSNACKF